MMMMMNGYINDIVNTFCDLARRAGINNSTKKEHLLIPGEYSELEVDFTLFQPNFNPSDAGRSFMFLQSSHLLPRPT
jgi:hypothetical protein